VAARWANRDHAPDPLFFGAPGDLYKAYLVAQKLPENARVLDLGCGSCTFLKRLELFKAFEGHGLDLAPPAQEHFRVHKYDGRHVPHADQSFDLVIIGYVLHHLGRDHAAELVREALRVVRPGGKLVIFEDSLGQFDRAYALRNWLHHTEAGLEYASESSSYVHPSTDRMFLTHDEWREFLSGVPGGSSVEVSSLNHLYDYRHHSMIVVERCLEAA
jgi:SAM-dependent methyltransferase